MSPRDEGAGTQWKIKEEIKEELGMMKRGCGGMFEPAHFGHGCGYTLSECGDLTL